MRRVHGLWLLFLSALAGCMRALLGPPLWIIRAFNGLANAIDPDMPESPWAPREWLPRLWSRDHDPRNDIKERRP
ncbi:hypothetical protein [Methylobacterium oxalidis]|uniref:hypothetical protein n=1 Tax=Methylobacterium oxalidis TaxID=944322 RepID=UPI00331491FD